MKPKRWVTALAWFVALQFFAFAPFKFLTRGLAGYPSYPEKFVRWGYPSWASFVVGAVEVLAALLLVVPRTRFLGAVLIMFTMTGAVTTHIVNHDRLTDSVAAPFELLLTVLIALAIWPPHWTTPFTGAAGADSR